MLGKFAPTQITNGIYELALNVVDANGAKSESAVTQDVYRDLKVGQFAITCEDLNVEAFGVPIRVKRTYHTCRNAAKTAHTSPIDLRGNLAIKSRDHTRFATGDWGFLRPGLADADHQCKF